MLDLIKTDKGYKVIKYTIQLVDGEIIRQVLSEKSDLKPYQALAYMSLELGMNLDEIKLGLNELVRLNKNRSNFGTQGNFIFSE